jgi:hypothetical protein
MAAESLLEKMHFLLKQKRDQRKRFMVGEKKHFGTKACSVQPDSGPKNSECEYKKNNPKT